MLKIKKKIRQIQTLLILLGKIVVQVHKKPNQVKGLSGAALLFVFLGSPKHFLMGNNKQ